MTEVFVILTEERHSDAEVEVWADESAAKGRARAIAEQFAHDENDIHEATDPEYGLTYGAPPAWVYWLGWGSEGDTVRVERMTINGGK